MIAQHNTNVCILITGHQAYEKEGFQ